MQDSVCSNIDAVLRRGLAKMTITKRDYWSIELGGHTQQFARALPNQAWVCDITYIRTRSGWLYLAAVLDLHSRKIVGWAMAPQMPATLVCAALQMAIVQRCVRKNLTTTVPRTF